MSNCYKPLYEDTDSAVLRYCENDVMATKQMLNSLYGLKLKGEKMNREYIVVIVNDNPVVIFKSSIVAVTKNNEDDNRTQIMCNNGYCFLTKEDYASVVKKIIG